MDAFAAQIPICLPACLEPGAVNPDSNISIRKVPARRRQIFVPSDVRTAVGIPADAAELILKLCERRPTVMRTTMVKMGTHIEVIALRQPHIGDPRHLNIPVPRRDQSHNHSIALGPKAS